MDEEPIPSLHPVWLQTTLEISTIPFPLHDGIALLLVSKERGLTRYALTKEQSRHLIRELRKSLDSLS